eukprot:IDg5386t1
MLRKGFPAARISCWKEKCYELRWMAAVFGRADTENGKLANVLEFLCCMGMVGYLAYMTVTQVAISLAGETHAQLRDASPSANSLHLLWHAALTLQERGVGE